MAAAKAAHPTEHHPIQSISPPPLMSHSLQSKIDAVLMAALTLLSGVGANAEPLRLRGDALVQTRSPAGLLMLRGEDRSLPWLDAEGVAWMGASAAREPLAATGDVLTLSVRARDLATGSELRAGRMIVSMGALRPVHVDGARALGRVFGGTTVEAFGGFPVLRLDQGALRSSRPFEWTAGGRIGQALTDTAAFGGSYAIRRQGPHRDDEEVGADVALTPTPWFTAAGRAAFDLLTYGPSDALASISVQKSDARAEIFTSHRSAGRLLPSTSLFSVLGDFAATSTGSTLRWRAFPRLEVIATGSLQLQGGAVGGQGLGRTTLALDDEWRSSIGLEARRVDVGAARWSGARVVASIPVARQVYAGAELELVCPDHPRGRGTFWPWALGSIAWRSPDGWELAAALEASSGPELRESVYTLGRMSYAFGASDRAESRGHGR
jgi:hypothetical protein